MAETRSQTRSCKKRVNWKPVLSEVRHFELDKNERANMSKVPNRNPANKTQMSMSVTELSNLDRLSTKTEGKNSLDNKFYGYTHENLFRYSC